MATEIIKTVKSSGGDYSSLSAWEAGQQGNLVTLDEIHTAECYAMDDTTAVLISGSTTDATRYLKVYTPSSERHDGKWNINKYRLEPADAMALEINDYFVLIDGLQFYITAPTGGRFHIYSRYGNNTAQHTIKNCIIRGNGTNYYGIEAASSIAVWKVINNIIYNCTPSFQGGIYSSATNSYIYNNTSVNNFYGIISAAGTCKAVNNLCSGNSNSNFAGTFTSSNYNASGSATATGGANDRVNQTFTFVDAANRDYHLASSDAGAKDFGTDLSGDANYPFSNDIDGQTRSGTWDIGADEYVAGGTQYNQALAGALTFSGLLPKQTNKILVGNASFNGSLLKNISKILIGGLTFSGALYSVKTFLKSLSGSLTFSGDIVKQTAKTIIGNLTLTGAVTKLTARLLSGTLTFTGSLSSIRTFLKTLTGAITFNGAITKQIGKSLNGSLTFSGSVLKQINKILSGGITFIGAVTKLTARLLSGALTFTGNILNVYIPIVVGAVYRYTVMKLQNAIKTFKKSDEIHIFKKEE